MKGVMIPEVSAGSNHVGASEMWAPQIMSPLGASERPPGASERPSGAAPPAVGPRITNAMTNNEAKRPRTRLMEASLVFIGYRLLSFTSSYGAENAYPAMIPMPDSSTFGPSPL